MNKTTLTKDGLEAFKRELDHLRSVQLSKAEVRIQQAVEDGHKEGDFQYDDAKAEFDFYERRSVYLEYSIKAARWDEEKGFYFINHQPKVIESTEQPQPKESVE